MAKDTKPDEIELKRDNFNTKKQQLAAERLQDHWPANFKDLGEQFDSDDDPSSSLYRKVYNEYFGVPSDDRTIEELRAQYGSMTNYLEQRKHGNINLDTKELTERELELFKEGYGEGYKDGYKEGLAESN